MKVSQNVNRQPTSPYGDIISLKKEYDNKQPIIDATQGLPNFSPNDTIKNNIANELLNGDLSSYTPRNGLEKLRKLIAQDVNHLYDCSINENNILITTGCNNAFVIAVSTFLNNDDEVILPNPFYFNHYMFLDIYGSSIKNVDTSKTNFAFNVEDLKKEITKKTKGIIITNPSNPTGVDVSSKVILDLMELCQLNDILFILDETYRINSQEKHNLFSLKDWDKTLVSINSLSKEFSLCGYRIGFIISSPEGIEQMQKVSECLTVCPSHIGQVAAIESLKHGKEIRSIQASNIKKKVSYFISKSKRLEGGFKLKSTGVYFAWIEYEMDIEPEIFVQELFKKTGVLSLPGNIFTKFDRKSIRLSFSSLTYPEIDDLINRLSKFHLS